MRAKLSCSNNENDFSELECLCHVPEFVLNHFSCFTQDLC